MTVTNTLNNMTDKIELSKIDFFFLLQELKDAKNLGFNYVSTMNDPMTSRYWVKRTASYELQLVADGEFHILVSKNHQRSHDEVKEQLIKRYTKWYKDFKAGKITTADLWLKKYGTK